MMSASTSDQISKSENCSHKKGTLYIIAGLTTQNLVFQLVHYFRYFLVRYEHLVENTMNVTNQLYRFSGLKFDDTAQTRPQADPRGGGRTGGLPAGQTRLLRPQSLAAGDGQENWEEDWTISWLSVFYEKDELQKSFCLSHLCSWKPVSYHNIYCLSLFANLLYKVFTWNP